MIEALLKIKSKVLILDHAFRQGEIRDRNTESQHFRITGLNLLTAIIIYWNTKRLGVAVAQREKTGLDTPTYLTPRLGPYHPHWRVSVATNKRKALPLYSAPSRSRPHIRKSYQFLFMLVHYFLYSIIK